MAAPQGAGRRGGQLTLRLASVIYRRLLDGSVAGPAAHVAAARLRCEDLYLVVVAASGAVQANFDLREDVELSWRREQTPPSTPSPRAFGVAHLGVPADGAAA